MWNEAPVYGYRRRGWAVLEYNTGGVVYVYRGGWYWSTDGVVYWYGRRRWWAVWDGALVGYCMGTRGGGGGQYV